MTRLTLNATKNLCQKYRVVMCRYNMTKFAMMLNEITPPGLERKVAPTDCRLRPDQHALEEGIYDQVITCAPAFASQAKQPFFWYDKGGADSMSVMQLPISRCSAWKKMAWAGSHYEATINWVIWLI